MAIREIEMNTGSLQNDIRELESLISQMDSQKKRLEQTVAEMNAMWTGQANAAFDAQFKTDMVNFAGMLSVLREMLKNLRTAKTEYDGCEQRIADVIGRIAI